MTYVKKCKICNHSNRDKIEAMLTLGSPLVEIFDLYGVNRSNIASHKKHCKIDIAANIVDINSTAYKREQDRIRTLENRRKMNVCEEDFEEPRWITEYKKIRRSLTPWENRW
jgi:hypothetical protein